MEMYKKKKIRKLRTEMLPKKDYSEDTDGNAEEEYSGDMEGNAEEKRKLGSYR